MTQWCAALMWTLGYIFGEIVQLQGKRTAQTAHCALVCCETNDVILVALKSKKQLATLLQITGRQSTKDEAPVLVVAPHRFVFFFADKLRFVIFVQKCILFPVVMQKFSRGAISYLLAPKGALYHIHL